MDTIEEMLQLLLVEHYYVFTLIVVILAFIWKSKPWRRQQKKDDIPVTTEKSTASASLQTNKKRTLLRGNLRIQLETLQLEKDELEVMVSELRTEIEIKDIQLSRALAEQPINIPAATTNTRVGVPTRLVGEFGTLGSCWALLILGLCFTTSKRQRRSAKRQCHPIRRTIKTAQVHSSVITDYFWKVVYPILSKNAKIVADEMRLHVTSKETVVGVAIAIIFETVEDITCHNIIPVVIRISTQVSEITENLASAIRAVDFNGSKRDEASANLIQELERQLGELRHSLRDEEKSRAVLKGEIERLKGALEGKEGLLYEERMKTRIWKLQHAKLRLEWEEAKGIEAQKQLEAARSSVADDQKRLVRGFLEEHLRSRQQKQELQILGFTSNKNNSLLPVPIQQGIAIAMNKTSRSSSNNDEFTNLSARYSECSMLSEREPCPLNMEQTAPGTRIDYERVCRDYDIEGEQSHRDVRQQEGDRRDESSEGYRLLDQLLEQKFNDNNESRLSEIRGRFLQSRSPSHATRPAASDSALNRTATQRMPWNNCNFHRQPSLSPFLFTANSATNPRETPGSRHFLRGNGGTSISGEAKPSSWTENHASTGMPTNE